MNKEEYENILLQKEKLQEQLFDIQDKIEAGKIEFILTFLDKLNWEYRRGYSYDLFITSLPKDIKNKLDEISDSYSISLNLTDKIRFSEHDNEFYLSFNKPQYLIEFLEDKPYLKNVLFSALTDSYDKVLEEKKKIDKQARDLKKKIKEFTKV